MRAGKACWFLGPRTQRLLKQGITWPGSVRVADVPVVVEKLSDAVTPFWSTNVECTVVPLCASVRTAPDSKPATFTKLFPDGFRVPRAQFVYVPIGKPVGGAWRSARGAARQPATPRASSVITQAFISGLTCPWPTMRIE